MFRETGAWLTLQYLCFIKSVEFQHLNDTTQCNSTHKSVIKIIKHAGSFIRALEYFVTKSKIYRALGVFNVIRKIAIEIMI